MQVLPEGMFGIFLNTTKFIIQCGDSFYEVIEMVPYNVSPADIADDDNYHLLLMSRYKMRYKPYKDSWIDSGFIPPGVPDTDEVRKFINSDSIVIKPLQILKALSHMDIAYLYDNKVMIQIDSLFN